MNVRNAKPVILAIPKSANANLKSKIGQPFEYEDKLQSLAIRPSSDLDSANPSEEEFVSVAIEPKQENRRPVAVQV
jgi:hypothetical protein